MSRYPAYNLDDIKRQLGKTAWREVLPVFAHVRMATGAQVSEALDGQLSDRSVRRALSAMVKAQDMAIAADDGPVEGWGDDDDTWTADTGRRVLVARKRLIVYRAGDRKGEKLYQLGAAGAALLREMGLVNDLRPSKLKRDVDIAHRLCALDVVLKARKAGVDAFAEKVLRNRDGKEIRADVAVLDKPEAWRLIEIEQAAEYANVSRRGDKLESLRKFYTGPAVEQVSPEIVVVFNLLADEMRSAVEEWRFALWQAEKKSRPLPFRLHPVWMCDFMAEPRWNGPLREDRPLTPLGNARAEVKQAARESERKPADVPPAKLDELGTKSQADLVGLFRDAYAIYALSRETADWRVKLGVPVASLRALRMWLERAGLVNALKDEFGLIRLHYSPQIVEQMLGRVVWGRLLRQWGVDRQMLGPEGMFRVSVETGKAKDQSAGYVGPYVSVAIADELWSTLKPERQAAGLEVDRKTVETAVGWLLSAPYTYALELGLT